MRRLTPTLAICIVGAVTAAGMLAAEPDAPAAPAAATVPAGAPAPSSAELTIESFAFGAPVVAAGGTIQVVNRDSVDHTVSATDGAFDVFVDGGAAATFTAPSAPGTYDFVCAIHPAMTGTVTVT
jgi:plastocyanin